MSTFPVPSVQTKTVALTRVTKALLAIICLNGLANSLSNVFVNVFLFRLSNNIYEVALFNFISYLVWLPAFVFAGWLCKKTDRRIGLIIGGGLQVLFYLLILFLAERSIEWIHLLGLCFGIGSGFYWLSVNVLSVDLTNQENRTWFNGVNGLFGSLSQMIGPFIAGILVSKLPNMTGYKVIFMLSLLLFIVTIVLTMLLPVIRLKNSFQWKKMYQVHRNKEWNQLTFAFIGLAFRDGVLSFVILLWVFVVTNSEAVVGNFAFLTTLLSVITYYLVGKFTKSAGQKWLLVIGNIGLSASIFTLMLDVNWFVLLFYGIISAICIPLFEVPFNTMSLNNIANLDENGLTRVELVTSREIALSVGRITSVGLLVIVYSSLQSELLLQYFLGLVIVVGMTPLLFIRRMKEIRSMKGT